MTHFALPQLGDESQTVGRQDQSSEPGQPVSSRCHTPESHGARDTTRNPVMLCQIGLELNLH